MHLERKLLYLRLSDCEYRLIGARRVQVAVAAVDNNRENAVNIGRGFATHSQLVVHRRT